MASGRKLLNRYEVIDDSTAKMYCGSCTVLLDAEDIELVKPFQWCINGNGYVTSGAGNTQVIMHRLIMGVKDNSLVDHANRNPLDNRKCNLRLCDKRGNLFNFGARSDNSCGYRGVRKHCSGKYTAQIAFKGKAYHIGCYDAAESAANAYDSAASVIAGEFAWRNLPQIPLDPVVMRRFADIKAHLSKR